MRKVFIALGSLFTIVMLLYQFRVIGYGYKIILGRDGERQKIEVWDGKIPDKKITICISNLKNPILITGSAQNLADPIETDWFKVKFKDETIKPGRVWIVFHGHDFDFSPDGVSIDGVRHEWKTFVEL